MAIGARAFIGAGNARYGMSFRASRPHPMQRGISATGAD
jgi:hypothetical protein